MTKWTLAGSTALATLAFGGMAQAQVTPEEVWQNWKDLSATYGQQLSATRESRDGDTFSVEGLRIVAEQEGVLVVAEIDDVDFTDLGDGTVEITMSPAYPMTITVDPEEGETEQTTIEVAISQPGLSVIAGGSADETSYDFSAPTVNLKVEGIDGVDAAAVDLTVDVTFTGLEGSYLISGTETREMTSAFSADSMAMAIAAKDPDTSSSFDMTATVAALEGTSDTTLVEGAMDMAELTDALKAGFAASGGFTYGKTAFAMDFVDPADSFKASGAAETGTFTFGLDEGSMAYGAGGTGVTMTVSGAQIPFPELTASYAEAGFDLLMPISKSDVAEDFRFVTRLVGLTVSDALWGMFDPGNVLPRDPATLVLDTSGKARLDFDIMDPAQSEAMANAAPGDLESLDVNELKLSVGGAELTGAGAFTFDNTDLVTFDGMPAPTGTLNLKLVGGNGLLDKLVQMGLIPDDQAMGARMMMGMFARPGDGADTLTSTIEFKDKGLYANGQRLQ